MNAPATSIATPAPASTRGRSTARAVPQLGLGGIIAVWAAAALPMGLLAWVVVTTSRGSAERSGRPEPHA